MEDEVAGVDVVGVVVLLVLEYDEVAGSSF